jgi:microcystin-dependent protein
MSYKNRFPSPWQPLFSLGYGIGVYNRTGAVGGANFNAVDLIDDSASEVTGQSEDESAHTHSISSAGSGTAHNNVQPTIIVNWILRVL